MKYIATMKIVALTGLVFLMTILTTFGQGDFGYGFRAGLSYSKFSGPLETGPDGAELESYDFGSGFHIGVNTAYKFTDLVGVRGEFMFSQRGTKYTYNGPSYYIVGLHTDETFLLNGTRDMELTITNAYIDIPITAYYKLGMFEIQGGAGFGVNVGSTGGGTIRFDGASSVSGIGVDPFEIGLNYNYKTNGAREIDGSATSLRIDGRDIATPDRVGAYYWYTEKNKNQINTFDAYLVGGLSVYLNEGLFLGGRIFYGLTDIDQNEYDISHQTSSGKNYVFREDDNKNITIQVSIGFSF